MKVWLQTRGITHDYAFLGTAPPDYWWTIPFYKDATSFEQPTLILERPQRGQWRCFISAIPSTRRDRVNTRIRYSLALCGEGESDKRVLLSLLAYVLDIFKNDPVSEGNPLTSHLDRWVGDRADEWLGGNIEPTQNDIGELGDIFAKLEQRKVEPLVLNTRLQDFFDNGSGSPDAAAILNFIGGSKEPSAEHLRSQLVSFPSKILILPSPVAGGKFTKYFVLSSPSCNLITRSGDGKNFLAGPQGDNTTEGPNTTRQSTIKRNDKSKYIACFCDNQLMITVIVVVVAFLALGWYMFSS